LYGLKTDDNCSAEVYDFFDYNNIWHEVEENKRFVFIGEKNISWFVYNPSNDEYLELDTPSAEVVEKFNSLDDLLESFLSDAIEYAS
ncbi:MAG: YrhA family protein, partial [Streptococcus sp.]